MSKPIKKISFILFLIILLPILAMTFREIISLNENENILEEIYKNQLESILTSVNLYSEDVVSNWTFNIDAATKNESTEQDFESWIGKFQKENHSIVSVFVSDKSLGSIKVYPPTAKSGDKIKTIGAENILKENSIKVNRLFEYLNAGYSKIEPVVSSVEMNNQYLLFILTDKRICGIEIAPKIFIEQNLASKIQSVARNEFAVDVFDSSSARVIYSVGETAGEYQQSKRLWLFPRYSLGIKLMGETIGDIVRGRTYTNIILFSGLGLLMFIVAWFGYKNIRKEVELAQIRSDFVSNVSHELRTPLALINMFAETLALGRVKNEEKRDEYYNIIQLETERLSKIVNKILSFSKIEAGTWKYNFTNADLNYIASRIYDTYKFHLENNGFNFILEKNDELLERSFDPEAVSEAIINLIDNAVKYSTENKKIILRTGKENNNIFVEVEDNGTGISKEDQNKIFDKFYRITSGNVHNTKGTGLGLTLVKHIVDAHKGKIKLTSELGKGSTFRLTFPLN